MASAAELHEIRAHKRDLYPLRTQFLDAGGEPRYINHLITADSPYLLQHAHNPVDWYPWGQAAFDKAAAENKPIFLSIGYSTCHWCHVMEEESFDDEEVAEALNRDFVSIKVDREQHPDLDEYYMAGVQIVTGHGGWPMSSFLTPDGKPFFGGTYFPRAQFLSLLEQAHQAWQGQPDRLRADADNVDQGIRRQLAPSAASELPEGLVDKVVDALLRHADDDHGGFGSAPKFPQEPNLSLLAEYVARDTRALADQPAWSTLRAALDAMLAGGIYDQVGGGFHRYATDVAWQVPHFEKMLYNQGQLAGVYLDAWQLSGDPEYRRIVEETLDYVIREMQAPEGGFHSATDADSEGEEGRYFVWRHDELAAALDADQLAFCESVFGATRGGNFKDANVLHLPQPLSEAAERSSLAPAAFNARLQAVRRRLYEVREQRPRPLRDDKHITEWNGMVIAALARAGRVLDRPDYREAAERAATYLWRVHHDTEHDMLWRTSLHGTASIAGQLEDYAHLIDGLIALYDVSDDEDWLDRARTLLAEARARHWDDQAGGFFGPPKLAGPQPMRSKNLMDNATISGNSLMPMIVLALHERTGDADLRALAEAQIAAFSGHIAQLPLAGPVFLQGLGRWHTPAPAPLQYLGGGAIRATCRAESLTHDRQQITLDLIIRPGWHIQPIDDSGDHATRLTIAHPQAWQQTALDAPPSEALAGAAGESGLAGHVRLTLEAQATTASIAPLVLDLQLQPCTERECLPAEHRRFVLHAVEIENG